MSRRPLLRRVAPFNPRSCDPGCHPVLALLSKGCPEPTRQVVYVLLTRAPLYRGAEAPFRVRLACVRHAASVRSEPGSNSLVDLVWPWAKPPSQRARLGHRSVKPASCSLTRGLVTGLQAQPARAQTCAPVPAQLKACRLLLSKIQRRCRPFSVPCAPCTARRRNRRGRAAFRHPCRPTGMAVLLRRPGPCRPCACPSQHCRLPLPTHPAAPSPRNPVLRGQTLLFICSRRRRQGITRRILRASMDGRQKSGRPAREQVPGPRHGARRA
jgi:hypothetical protein